MRIIKFEFIYKGIPFSSQNNEFNWHKKVYHLESFIDCALSDLSDVHDTCELVAKRQFTGLQDKKGVDIYDGDIVIWGDTEGYIELSGTRWAVVDYSAPSDGLTFAAFNPVKRRFKIGNFMYAKSTNKCMTVIGNIYENPELLEAKT